MNFRDAALDVKSLQEYFADKREEITSNSIECGISRCEEMGVEIKLPSIKKRQLTISRNRNNAGEMIATEKYEDEKKELRKVVYGAVDRMRVEMNDRFKRLEETDRRFGFVLDIDNLMYRQLNEATIKLSCSYLSSIYSQDLDGDDLWDEISDCRMMLKAHPKVSSPLELLKFIIQYGDESLFPNLRVSLQIMLTVGV